ncbi:hypothetical protein ACFQ1S_16910 [Kibdelosporangium lantanae]|uniref:Uncharacterized protein n=1 Tax=Kibdelosporangium lantanae TaxID=1497396 RepID=A0ABW3MDQ9_9PSEU
MAPETEPEPPKTERTAEPRPRLDQDLRLSPGMHVLSLGTTAKEK